LRGFWLSDFPRVAAVSRIFFSFSCCSRPELGVRSPSGWCLTRTRASTAGSGLFLFIFFCLRSPAVSSGSSHRECCQAKAFSAHPDLIFLRVSKGARRPEILLGFGLGLSTTNSLPDFCEFSSFLSGLSSLIARTDSCSALCSPP
jgi:hypothetical protein